MIPKAEWLESTDKTICLCCGQKVMHPGKPMSRERSLRALLMFNAFGLTRDDLLGKHREQLEYQSPGFVAWLEGQ